MVCLLILSKHTLKQQQKMKRPGRRKKEKKKMERKELARKATDRRNDRHDR